MAFTVGTSLTDWGSASTLSAITFTGVAVPAGSTLVLGWSANVQSLTATIADNSTQAGAANQYVLRTPLPGTTFTAQTIYCLKITRAILSSDTITITLSGAVTRSAAKGLFFTPANGNAQLENRSSAGNDSTSPVAAPVMSTTQWVTNEMAVAFGFWKGGAVASGFANASANMTGGATVGSISSGGITTRVETALAYTVGLGTTAWTPSYTYTSITMGATEGLSFTDHAKPTGCVQYHSFPRGTAVASQAVEIGPCTAGNLLIMAVATNENTSPDNITTPTGWNLAGTFRQGTIDVNIAVFTRIATGGETTWTVTTSVAQRMQVHVSEWSGFTERQDGANSTAGNSVGVTTYDSGTVTPTGPGRLFYAVVVEKNGAAMTEGGGFSQLLSNNEAPGTLSTQKLAMMVVADANRSTAAREQPTSGTSAAYAGMGFLFESPEFVNPVVTSGKGAGGYPDPLSRVFSIFDNPAAGAVQVLPQIARSRPSLNYSSRGSVAVGAAQEEFHGSEYVRPATDQEQPYYDTPPSFVTPVYDSAAAPDAWVSVAASRRADEARLRRSLVTPAYFDPASVWATVTASQRAEAARARRSIVSGVFIDTPAAAADAWVHVTRSRIQANYRGSWSAAFGAASEPVFGSEYVAPTVSRRVENYATTRSRVLSAFVNTAVAGDSWAQVYQSRQQEPLATRSYYAVTWDDHACTTLYPDTMLLPDSMLFPDMCPVVEIGLVTQSRPGSLYDAGPSDTVSAFTPNADAWAQTYQSRDLAYYRGSYSAAFGAAVESAAAADTWASVIQSVVARAMARGRSVVTQAYPDNVPDVWASSIAARAVPNYAAPLGQAIVVYDQSRTTTWAFVTMSRPVPFFDPLASRYIYAFDGPSGIIPDNPSAGGGATFMLTGDPFRDPFANPFRDPFAVDKFLPMPKKR